MGYSFKDTDTEVNIILGTDCVQNINLIVLCLNTPAFSYAKFNYNAG